MVADALPEVDVGGGEGVGIRRRDDPTTGRLGQVGQRGGVGLAGLERHPVEVALAVGQRVGGLVGRGLGIGVGAVAEAADGVGTGSDRKYVAAGKGVSVRVKI